MKPRLTMSEMVATGGPVRRAPAPRPPGIRVGTWTGHDWRQDYYALRVRMAREELEKAEASLADALSGVHFRPGYGTIAFSSVLLGESETALESHLRDKVKRAQESLDQEEKRMQTELYGPGYLVEDEDDDE